MTVYGHILPGAQSIANWAYKVDNLTQEEKHRIKVMDWWMANGKNASLTARHFGHHRKTVECWVKRFKVQGISGLRSKSKRPHTFRAGTLRSRIRNEVLSVRKRYPRWSKYKISNYLGMPEKASSIGRILKESGCINAKVSRKRKKAARYPKKRFPRGLVVKKAGQLIQVDTKHLTGMGGKKLYQFTAIDVLTKLRVMEVSTSPSSLQAKRFLFTCLQEFPFDIEAVQTDNGGEFLKYFDKYCKELDIDHYFIDTRSPKQNSYVERSHRTDDEEFYSLGNMRDTVASLRPLLKDWQYVYNHIRPHQSLNYMTPVNYFQRLEVTTLATRDYICLQA